MVEKTHLRHRKELRKPKDASAEGKQKQQHIEDKIHNETSICSILANHQLSISVGSLLVVLLSNQISVFQPFAQKFITLQYRSGFNAYGIGTDDAYFVFFWVINLTVIRACLMRVVLNPFARYFSITKNSAMRRFEEQGWSLFYYTTSWVSGFILYYHSDYWLDCDNLYIGWPHEKMTFWFKSYYLIQMSCWLQQIIVLNIEKKRKDYLQMFSHHIITCLLVIGSYYYYFTRIGHVILVLMDVVDIFLAAAKMLKYCGFTISCDLMFIVFVLSWSVLRHGVYNYLLYHAMFHSKELMNGDCVAGVLTSRCYSDNVIRVFLGLLTGLQVIAIIWMYLIIKVVVKVIRGTGAEDVRSDDED